MLRGVLFVLLFCSSAWAALAQVVPASSDAIMTVAGADTCVQPNDSRSTGDSDDRWDTQHRNTASITESGWKSPVAHAGLAGARCADVFVEMRTPVSPIVPLATLRDTCSAFVS